jgi:predicted nucleic acid-binding protein
MISIDTNILLHAYNAERNNPNRRLLENGPVMDHV